MSSSKYDKIGNYNLSYELLKDAVREFQGYLVGLSQNDIWLFEDSIRSSMIPSTQSSVDKDLDLFIKQIAPRILDRTTGTYFLDSLRTAENISSLSPYVTNGIPVIDDELTLGFIKKVMTFVPGYYQKGGGESANRLLGAYRNFVQEEIVTSDNKVAESSLDIEDIISDSLDRLGATLVNIDDQTYRTSPSEGKVYSMNDCLYYYNVKGLLKDKVTKDVKNKETGVVEKVVQYLDSENKEPKMFSSDVEVDQNILNVPEINRSGTGYPDRFYSPSLGAIVMQHPKASIASKGKEHLPIFFNAIPPIEMARCVPYIDIRVLTENYSRDAMGNKTAPSNLNSVAYMRFTRNDKGKFSFDDGGFGEIKPVAKSVNHAERKALENIDMAYMDIFTSPQTLANANINNGPTSWGQWGGVNDDPILEPIMPFLSLDSLNVSITGAGYGIMSSKRASLKLTLHDRSRLRDLAPLVSSSQFATTRILIEYGWNHPEGGPGSDNVIGKYLNALKDRSVYQVVKCDYDFSDGSAVGIDIGLAAYGFRQTERIHCGAGPEIPLNVFSEYIEKVTDDLIKDNSKADKAPEIRQKIKLNERSARSTNNSLSWSSYRNIISSLKNKLTAESALQALKDIFDLESVINTSDRKTKLEEITKRLEGDIIGATVFNQFKQAGLFDMEDEKETMLQRVYGKLKAFEDPRIGDPFITSMVYGSNDMDNMLSLEKDGVGTGFDQKMYFTFPESMMGEDFQDYVTLGKVIANYIGYPLASSCLYDEVQMVFYPMNHQSGGGRIHTTASFPIPISRLRTEIQNSVKTSSNISVKRMFSILERIVKDRNLQPYGIGDLFTSKDNFSEKETTDKLLTILQICCNGEPASEDIGWLSKDIDKQILDTFNINNKAKFSNKKSLESGFFSKDYDGGKMRKRLEELLKEYQKNETNKLKVALSSRLTSLYSSDGLSQDFPGVDKFVRPNISLDFEVIDAIDTNTSRGELKFWGNFIRNIMPPTDVDNGLVEGKTILRLHIYDEETIPSPSEFTLMSTMTEGSTGKVVAGNDAKEKIGLFAKKLNFNQAKQFVKRSYPTLIYGAAGSTVRSLSVNANTSGEMANILMVESYGNLKEGQVNAMASDDGFDSVTMFPNTVSCTMMGMPMIGRGNSIFIDFGTNTSLDNIYTVKNVTHTIRAGDFSTTLELVPPNMGAVSNFKKDLSNIYPTK